MMNSKHFAFVIAMLFTPCRQTLHLRITYLPESQMLKIINREIFL